jgi:hypothetical protein
MKPPVIFRDWLAYHYLRDKPIKRVALSRDEKSRKEQVAETFCAVCQLVTFSHSTTSDPPTGHGPHHKA